jgi:hypothetical protein
MHGLMTSMMIRGAGCITPSMNADYLSRNLRFQQPRNASSVQGALLPAGQLSVLALTQRRYAAQVLVKGGTGDLQQVARPLDVAPARFHRLDERVDVHRVTLAKKAVARLRISRLHATAGSPGAARPVEQGFPRDRLGAPPRHARPAAQRDQMQPGMAAGTAMDWRSSRWSWPKTGPAARPSGCAGAV